MRLSSRLHLLALASVAAMLVALLVTTNISFRAAAGAAAIASIISLALAALVSRGITRSLTELRDTLHALASHRFSARPPLHLRAELGELSNAVRRLAEELQNQSQSLKGEDTILVAMMDSLSEGVVAVDRGQAIVRINPAAREMLGIASATPFPLSRLPRHQVLHAALVSAQRGSEPQPFELRHKDKLLLVTVRPLRGGGALVALFDMTTTRRLELVRRDFVANVSHELRTPLTVIGGFAETLATDDPPADTRRQFAETIRDNAERMRRIVDDLLDLSRLESGGWVPALTEVNVPAVIDDVFTAARPSAERKGLALESRVDASARTITADRVAVNQVLSNLVNNSIRHTSSGTIMIASSLESNGVSLSVSDTGPGIPAEHLPRIFERFYRVDSGRSRDSGGTGLGLAIVKHLVEAHGGTLRATSEVGKGTTISAFFPRQSLEA